MPCKCKIPGKYKVSLSLPINVVFAVVPKRLNMWMIWRRPPPSLVVLVRNPIYNEQMPMTKQQLHTNPTE